MHILLLILFCILTSLTGMCCAHILLLILFCILTVSPGCCSGAQPCEMLPMVMLSVHLTQCAPNQCGQYGTCQTYMEATTVFAGCQCLYGTSLFSAALHQSVWFSTVVQLSTVCRHCIGYASSQPNNGTVVRIKDHQLLPDLTDVCQN